MNGDCWISNVKLETGFRRKEDGSIIGTETAAYHLRLGDGFVKELIPASEPLSVALPIIEGSSYLLLPSFSEMHLHLDKTLIGEAWQAIPPGKGVVERSELEHKTLSEHAHTTAARAERLLQTVMDAGSTYVRTHVDIYPAIGLKYLKEIQSVLEAYDGKLAYDIVAFPQQGLLRSGSKELLRAAMREGATMVGGVDPATVDIDIERSLQEMVEIAVEFGGGIDLHLHDPDYLGTHTIRRLAQLTIEAGLQGKVSVSHAFCLGEVPEGATADLAGLLRKAGIRIINSVHHKATLPHVQVLQRYGVPFSLGCDNVQDSWQPFGNGNLLERAGRLSERLRWLDEYSLNRALGCITDGVMPLDAGGNRVWPQPGDVANLVLMDASCSSEAIARRRACKAVFFRGAHVAGKLMSAGERMVVV
ncbi:amidohydrolase [Paenibacillus glycanilyticus]|uniref:Deaminase n=1 Tax=Paenibacillus glycanilyticus TaxID=126569 RepID=A0ABQ6GA84_9BACL|nr:amidohydrolase [Paenibacillus glycanilyticus]GLX67160.1 deaminase [Paenibacillus glycanilyticus]